MSSIGEASDDISLVTFNVGNSWALGRQPAVSAWWPWGSSTMVEVLETEAFASADLILLQEIHVEGHPVDEALLEHLAASGLSVAYAPARPGARSRQGQMIVSRYPIVNKGFLRLPRARPRIDRTALWVDVEIRGQRWRVYNLHLENKTDGRQRTWQLDKVLRHAAPLMAQGIPVVVAGDFNTLHKGAAWARVSRDPTILYARRWLHSALTRYASTTLYSLQLDWIFYRNLTLRRAEVLDMILSDHYPVRAVFAAPGETP